VSSLPQLIKLTDIIIEGDRQRKDFKPEFIQEMSEGILTKGLLHAPVMRDAPGEPVRKILVAGETRLKAISNLWALGGTLRYNNQAVPEGYVPYSNLGDLTPLQAEEAELEENIRREALSWQEESAAIAKLHRIRSQQAQAEGRVHAVADTAVEVRGSSDGSNQEAVRRQIIVSKYLDNPEVAKAKDTNEAFKIIKRQEVQQQNVRLAATVGAVHTSGIHEAFNVNCLQWMASADAESVDVVLTDPPYGMGADTFGDGGGGRLANNEHHYKDDYDGWKALMAAWAPLSYRIAKREAHAYVFCDIDNFHELKAMMQNAGWYVFRTPFICTKPGSGRVPLPFEGPRRQYETLLYAIKGHKKTTAIYPDVLTSYADANTTHGAQKPVGLYVQLLQRSVKPGDVILDSFSGSGTIFPAADEMKCKAIGLEMNPEYYAMGYQRLKDLSLPRDVTDGGALAAELKGLMG
jgi:DNA modification methylase